MTPISPDSAYVSRSMKPDAAQLPTPALAEYAQVRARASWHLVQRPSEQISQRRHPSCRGKTDEHHRLPDRLPKSVTTVAQDDSASMTTTVTARKPSLPEERLSRCRR